MTILDNLRSEFKSCKLNSWVWILKLNQDYLLRMKLHAYEFTASKHACLDEQVDLVGSNTNIMYLFIYFSEGWRVGVGEGTIG